MQTITAIPLEFSNLLGISRQSFVILGKVQGESGQGQSERGESAGKERVSCSEKANWEQWKAGWVEG